jgi:phage terminase small subunit
MEPDLFEPELGNGGKPSEEMLLTAKKRRFSEEYVVDLSVGKAADRAGIKDGTAYAYMNQQVVRDYIQKLMDERAQETAVNARYVLSTIVDTIERCRQAAPVMKYDKVAGTYIESGEFKFDSAAVLKGCELLGKHLVLFTDKVEQKTETSISDIDEKLAALLSKYKD